MIPSLAPCFPEALAWYKDKLALPGEHVSVMPGRDLLDGVVIEGLMSRFARTYPGGDRRALVSMWTQWHFAALVIPTAAAILMLDRDLPIDLDQVGIAQHEDGRTAALVITHDGKPHAGAADRFARLVDGHVEPLVRHVASQFGVSQRVLWTNAAAILEWTVQGALTTGQVHPVALSEARLWLERQTDAAGRRNPMCGAVRYPLLDGEPTRQRKVCCLRYLLPGVAGCGSLCPLPEISDLAQRQAG
ncbi:Ferric iron reductase [Bosea sp. LC85]|uniref:siderophore-iron reductase FhuF n=1 Tax=Bosea sp. LC85 TaxID=1502851 RepID=UPI0004E463CE|nr:siderophore-iron reductase FhuF [Bosea sp. LC85]KFC63277.1 Ferric iron reductase [Bosea sp. LC85]